MSEFITNLDYQVIQKASEKYKNIVEAVISLEVDGEQIPFKVELYKVFSPVQIKGCVQEFIEKIEKTKGKNKNQFGDIMMPYLMFLCVKHFTTLKLPENFNEQILAIDNMLNTGALMQIYLNFDPTQLELIKEEVENVLETFSNNIDVIEKIKLDYYDKIENKFILD